MLFKVLLITCSDFFTSDIVFFIPRWFFWGWGSLISSFFYQDPMSPTFVTIESVFTTAVFVSVALSSVVLVLFPLIHFSLGPG